MDLFSSFCFSPEFVDLRVAELWVNGLTVSQASSKRETDDRIPRDLVEIDTADQFRLLEELQPVLEEPKSRTCLVEISPHVRSILQEMFYSFDEQVVREFLGRKFTPRARKEMDDVSESTGVLKLSCFRQFDNFRRLYDACDEIGFQVGNPAKHATLGEVLAEEFCFSRKLLARYEVVLFLMYHRCNISSAKKKLVFLTLRDFEVCAQTIMAVWCVKHHSNIRHMSSSNFLAHQSSQSMDLVLQNSPPVVESPPIMPNNSSGVMMISPHSSMLGITSESFCPFELDVSIILKSRELKNKSGVAPNELWNIVSSSIVSLQEGDKKRNEYNFKSWFRALLACGAVKDLKDFFEDLVTDVVEPMLDLRCDLEELFDVVDRAVSSVLNASDVPTWQTLMSGVRPCVIRIASAYPHNLDE